MGNKKVFIFVPGCNYISRLCKNGMSLKWILKPKFISHILWWTAVRILFVSALVVYNCSKSVLCEVCVTWRMRTKSAQLVPNWKFALIISFEKLHIACELSVSSTYESCKWFARQKSSKSQMGEAALPLTIVLLGLIVFLVIALIILTRFIRQLAGVIQKLNSSGHTTSFLNSPKDMEIKQKESATPGLFRKPPIWLEGSTENVENVPPRQEFHKEKENELDMRKLSFETFQIPDNWRVNLSGITMKIRLMKATMCHCLCSTSPNPKPWPLALFDPPPAKKNSWWVQK